MKYFRILVVLIASFWSNILLLDLGSAAQCGRQMPRNLISNGLFAYPGQYPWVARIAAYYYDSELIHSSQAVLIADQWLVTSGSALILNGYGSNRYDKSR